MSLSSQKISAKEVSKCVNDRKLDLTEKKLGDDSLEVIGQLEIGTLILLSLAKVLGKHKALNSLEFFGNKITDKGVPQLINMLDTNKNITTLKLEFNLITADGAKQFAEFLKTNKTLQKLELYENKIGDTGCIEIARALLSNTMLNSLGLFGNGITNEGAIVMCGALMHNTTLTYLNLDHNKIDDELLEVIEEHILRNKGEAPDDIVIPEKYFQSIPEDIKKMRKSVEGDL